MGRTRTFSPARFRSRVLPALHDSWEEAASALLADPDEQLRIRELRQELSANGFEFPVYAGRDRWWSGQLRVRDGMHRSIAALQLGLDIPLRVGDPQREGYDAYDRYIVTLDDAAGDFEGVCDRVLSLASFRSGDGFWVTWASASTDRTASEVELVLPRRETRRAAIAQELAERLTAAGTPAEVRFTGEG